MSSGKVSEIVLKLDSEKWEERQLSNGEVFYVPKNMLEASCEKDFQSIKKHRLPYIRVVTESRFSKQIEASPGLIRAVPIFYSFDDRKLIICDKPFRSRETKSEIKGLSLLEFLSFGYVTGNRTIMNDIFQLQAGEVLQVKENEWATYNDYLYDASSIEQKSEKELTDELEKVTKKIFSSLMRNLEGRIPVIPLSGGYDSRLIASMLKLGGVDRAICISYSIPGNFESQISKMVAEKLGFEWHYIEYNTKKWNRVFHSKQFDDYIHFAHNLTSVSCFQEFLSTQYFDTAVRSFDKTNYVFVPGHAADFVAGSHLNPAILAATNIEDVAKCTVSKHYGLRMSPVNNTVLQEVRRRVAEYSKITPEPFKLFEIWNWRERQSKFIANANRIYDYFGYKWTLPFWSKEFTDFWGKIPLEMKYKKRLYDEFLENRVFNRLGVDIDREERVTKREIELKVLDSRRPTLKQRIVNVAKENKFVADLYRSTRRKLRGPSNPCAFDTANPFLLKTAKEKFPRGYQTLEKLLEQEFPKGRGGDPNSYVADYIISSILEDYGDNIAWE